MTKPIYEDEHLTITRWSEGLRVETFAGRDVYDSVVIPPEGVEKLRLALDEPAIPIPPDVRARAVALHLFGQPHEQCERAILDLLAETRSTDAWREERRRKLERLADRLEGDDAHLVRSAARAIQDAQDVVSNLEPLVIEARRAIQIVTNCECPCASCWQALGKVHGIARKT